MAVTAFGQGYKITSTDVLNQATVGNKHVNSPYVTRVNAIHIVAGDATAATVIRAGGASGTIIWSGVPTDNATTIIPFAQPQDIDDLAVSAISENSEVIVFIA